MSVPLFLMLLICTSAAQTISCTEKNSIIKKMTIDNFADTYKEEIKKELKKDQLKMKEKKKHRETGEYRKRLSTAQTHTTTEEEDKRVAQSLRPEESTQEPLHEFYKKIYSQIIQEPFSSHAVSQTDYPIFSKEVIMQEETKKTDILDYIISFYYQKDLYIIHDMFYVLEKKGTKNLVDDKNWVHVQGLQIPFQDTYIILPVPDVYHNRLIGQLCSELDKKVYSIFIGIYLYFHKASLDSNHAPKT